jgi:hypothetical protein
VLREFVPQAMQIAILVDPTTNSTRRQLEKAARDTGAQISFFEAQDRAQIAQAALLLRACSTAQTPQSSCRPIRSRKRWETQPQAPAIVAC